MSDQSTTESPETLSAKTEQAIVSSEASMRLGSARGVTRPTTSARVAPRRPLLPGWAMAATVVWLSMSVSYLYFVGGLSFTPLAIAGILAGISAPLMVVWLVALIQMRSMEIESITGPVRRQLAALLAPGAAADARVRRVTQALAEQADHLRHAAGVALDDSTAAMSALTRQSSELRRLAGESLGELGKIGSTADQTLKNLQSALSQINVQSGTERERALNMVVELETHIRNVLEQVDRLSGSYEEKLSKLTDTSDRLESRTKSLVELTQGVDSKVESAADSVLGDLDRLESAVAEVGQRSAAIAHQLGRPVESLETAARHLDTNMRQSQEMLSNATRNLEKIGDNAMSRASSLVATLSDRLSSMELVGAKLVSVGASAQADTGRYVSQIEAAAERIRGQTELTQQHLRQALRDFETISDRSTDQASQLVSRLESGTDNLAEILSTSDEKFDSLARDIEKRAARIGDLSHEARSQMEEARLVLDSAQDNFAEQLTRLGSLNSDLVEKVAKADASATLITAASQTAHREAEALMAASSQTRETLDSISTLLGGQQASVEELAISLNQQVEMLTVGLASQQEAIRQAANAAAGHGDNTRAVLREQVQAIGAATMEAAARLDELNARLTAETGDLSGVADMFSGRLVELVEDVEKQSTRIDNVSHRFAVEQKTLAGIADMTGVKLGDLTQKLTETQMGAVNAMDDVALRLSVLRSEVATAENSLSEMSSNVSSRQQQMTTDSSALIGNLDSTLSRLEMLNAGLDSAGRTISAQGQVASALLDQTCQQIVSASNMLRDESHTGAMSLSEVGDEILRQQTHLRDLMSSVEKISSELQSTSTISVRTQGELDTVISRLGFAAEAVGLGSSQSVAAISAAETSLNEAAQSLRSETANTDNRVLQLQQDMEMLQSILGSLSIKSDELATNLAHHAVEADKATGRMQGASHVADQATQQLISRMNELGNVAEAQQQRISELGEVVHEAGEQLSQTAELGQSALRTLLSEFSQTSERADILLEKMVERIKSTGQATGQEAVHTQTLLSDLTEALRSTAAEFAQRVDQADARVSAHHSLLHSLAQEMNQQADDTSEMIDRMAVSTGTARGEFEAVHSTISSVSAKVAEAIASLIADIDRMSLVSENGVEHLSHLGSQVTTNLADMQTAGMAAATQQKDLTTQLAAAQEGLVTLSHQVEGVRDIVSQMSDHATVRLADVSTLFVERVREGEQIITGASERFEATGVTARDQAQLLEQVASIALARMEGVAENNRTVHTQLVEQGAHNERMVSGLAHLAEGTTQELERAGQRMAMLAQQASSDSARMINVTERIEQQQTALRHAADAAVAVLHSVESQLKQSGESSVSLIDAAESKVSDVLIAMTSRLTALSQQNEMLMSELRATTERFNAATDEMNDRSRAMGENMEALGHNLHGRAIDLTAAGQQFDRELKARLASLESTQQGLDGYFSGFGQSLAMIDTQTSGYLVDLERRSEDAFGRLQLGVDQLADMPVQISSAQDVLSAQVSLARQEIDNLRQDLVALGHEVQDQMMNANSSSGLLLGNMKDVVIQSRLAAEQMEHMTTQLTVSAEGAWNKMSQAIAENTGSLDGLTAALDWSEVKATQIGAVAREQLESMLARVTELGLVVEGSLNRLNLNYSQMDEGVSKLSETTMVAGTNLTSVASSIEKHQAAIAENAEHLQDQIEVMGGDLKLLLADLTGLEGRLDEVTPTVENQHNKLETFMLTVERTLAQVGALQTSTRDIAAEHLLLANNVQAHEARLLASAHELDSKLTHLDSSLSSAVLERLESAVEHIQTVDGQLDRISGQAGRIDEALADVRKSLSQDVASLQQAESAITNVSERTALKLLEVGSALNGTLNQLQKGGQLSQVGLSQTNEEAQRLVQRLEQVRAMVKTMVGAVNSDVGEWQGSLKRQMETVAAEASERIASLAPIAGPRLENAAALAASAARPRAVAAPVPSSAQLTNEALHALAVDLYRLLHSEVPDFRHDLMPPSARRQPMTPEDARAYTKALLEQKDGALNTQVGALYRRNFEFRQYVDRYLARFEAQYDVLARSSGGVSEAAATLQGETGLLYETLATAIERKGVRTIAGATA